MLRVFHLGVEFQPGKPPSTMQLLRLASNSEFRAGAKRVAEEFKKAGIEIDQKVR